ncbi:DUF2628 domain-containing protein [Aureimonas sp. AU12]|uniref:DUF2628 domain-containing protein n=1 Tax=Aureimonas sp. AU12 TaxID=1638161 RepID=UPI0007850C0B|nr:DUF2628 domain-containing protein [Aureimonas sp. AU12]
MTTRWIVLEPAGTVERSDAAVFVRDAFRPIAVVLPAVWLLRYRLWLPAVATVLFDLGVGLVAQDRGFGFAAAALPLLLGLAVALEGPTLRIRRFKRKGFRKAALVIAADRRDAEAIYFSGEASEADGLGDPLPGVIAQAEVPSGPSIRRPAGRNLFDGARP